jgi:hypothetical protein
MAHETRDTESQETTRRLQMGGLGLFVVLLMISIAGLMGERDGVDRPSDPTDAANGLDMTASNEPLVDLGVQPPLTDSGAQNDVTPVPPPATQPNTAPQVVPDLRPDPELERAKRQAQ